MIKSKAVIKAKYVYRKNIKERVTKLGVTYVIYTENSLFRPSIETFFIDSNKTQRSIIKKKVDRSGKHR